MRRQFRRARSLPSKAGAVSGPESSGGTPGWGGGAVPCPAPGVPIPRLPVHSRNARRPQLRRCPSVHPSHAEPSRRRCSRATRALARGRAPGRLPRLWAGHAAGAQAGPPRQQRPPGPGCPWGEPVGSVSPSHSSGTLVGTHLQSQARVGTLRWPPMAARPLLNKITDAGVSVCNSLSTRILLGRRSSGGAGALAPREPGRFQRRVQPPQLPPSAGPAYLWM